MLAMNQKARLLLDFPKGSFLGRPWQEVLQQVTGLGHGVFEPLDKHGARILCSLNFRKGVSKKRTIAISRHALQSPFQNVAGILLSFEDVTYLAMLEDQIERQHRFSALQEVAVNLTQELKNPLGSLELFVSLLRRDLADDHDSERILSQMMLSVRSMDHLLDNYVTMARQPAAGPGRVDIREWLEQTAEQLRILAPCNGCSICCVYAHTREKIAGDGKLLYQMALNLGLNGLESMEKDGVLEISTSEVPAAEDQPAYLQVSFADRGGGVPVAFRSKVFDPFFSTKDRAHGLGLAIVHHVVHAHQGLITLSDRQGGGTVFSVLLPREADC